jgi:hypothetical protein
VAKEEHDKQSSEHKSVGLIAETHEKACLSLQKRLLDLEEVNIRGLGFRVQDLGCGV